jgi:transglutaminase-like putative cysteine protease
MLALSSVSASKTPEINMLIRLGYDIQFDIPRPVAMVGMLNVHPSRAADLREADEVTVSPEVKVDTYVDSYGNRCVRWLAPAGQLRITNSTLIEDSGAPDETDPEAQEHPVNELPPDVLRYLLNSRYCEVDRLSNIAIELFGDMKPGWTRVHAICSWINGKVTFGYQHARSLKTALDVFTERTGVCRDFQHLAITFCRALNIPARYATGYLGDIGVPIQPCPMDFSAWFEVYLQNRWWTFDARHVVPRIGRMLMATGRDASDVAITTSFGSASLTGFTVVTHEVTSSVIEQPA